MKKKFFLNSTNILDGIIFVARTLTVILFIILITVYFNQPSHNRSLNPFILPRYEAMMAISFYLAMLGLLVAWKAEGLGGFITIAGLVAFSIIDFLTSGSVLWNIWVLAIPAVLYLIYWWYTNVSEDFDVYRS